MTKTLFGFSLLLALLTGCATSRITNLTSTELPRSANNMYRVEYQWETSQQTVRPDSIKPYVIVRSEHIPMKRVMNNRWEAWIHVPPTENEATYRFQVDYDYTGFGQVHMAALRSRDYKLVIK